jgi:hypothetical protein
MECWDISFADTAVAKIDCGRGDWGVGAGASTATGAEGTATASEELTLRCLGISAFFPRAGAIADSPAGKTATASKDFTSVVRYFGVSVFSSPFPNFGNRFCSFMR